MENPNSVFYHVEHAPMDMNLPSQDDTPFTLGIQTPQQTKMMKKLDIRVQSLLMQHLAQTRGGYVSSIVLHLQIKLCISITYLTIIPNTTLLLFVVPLLHHDGLE